MSEPAEPHAPQAPASFWNRSPLLWLVSLFLIGFGAKLWLIHTYGTSVPFLDQWEEARVVYSPFLEGKLKWADLFSAHNEHRIFFTRIYDLALVLLNGQWDNQLQMVINAAIHVATLVGLGWLMIRLLGQKYAPVIVLPLAAALALPFGWENAMSGFHSQHYFMVVFALPTLWLLGIHPAWSWRWWCGVFFAGGGLFTVGAGFVAALAVCGLVMLKILLDRSSWKKHAPTLVVGIVTVGAGLALRVEVAHHEILKAHSVMELLISLGKYLSWPWIVLPPFAVFNMFPVALLAWFYFRHREARTHATEIILLIGLWTGLQCLAAAYARGAHGGHPQWRYMDTTSFLMIVNVLSLLVLWTQHKTRLPFARYFPAASGLWVLACVSGLTLLSFQAWRWDIPTRASQHRMQLLTTRGYLATGDERFLHVRKEYLARFEGDPALPQNHAEILIRYLNLPHIRSLLPASVRTPIPVRPDKVTGFATNDAATPSRHIAGEICWSSLGESGATGKRIFESQPIAKARLPLLEIRVTGDLGQPGLSLAIVDLNSGRTTEIKPRTSPGQTWQNYRISAPAGAFKLIATDDNPNGWFAFQEPREAGWLSVMAERASKSGYLLFVLGLGSFLALCIFDSWARRWRNRLF